MIGLPPIDTPRKPVTDTYHGVEVVDEYRWLEDKGSEATREWTAAQDARTRAYLEALPFRDAIRRRFEEILKVESTAYDDLSLGGSTYFALKTQPPLQQPFLLALDGLDDTAGERVLVDPNALDASGAITIDWYSPSPDGSRVAVSLSEHGTEDGNVRVYDVASGETVDGPLSHVNSGTAGGSLAWRVDSGAFWYTWHAAPGTVPDADLGFYQEVWFHELGTDAGRRELAGIFAEDRIAENFLHASPDGRWVMDLVQKATAASGRSSCAGRRTTRAGGWSPTSATSASARCSAAGGCFCSRCAMPRVGGCCASSSVTRRPSPRRLWSCRRAISRSRRLRRPAPGCGWSTSTAAPRASAPSTTMGKLSRRFRCRRSARSGARWSSAATRSRGRWRRSSRPARGGCTPTTTPSRGAPRWTPPRRSNSRASRSSACSQPLRTAPASRSTSSTGRARRRTARPRRCSTPTAASRSRSSRRLSRLGCCGSSTAACSPLRTFAAAASTAASGTTPGGLRPSRTASTTSRPAPTTSCTRV